jgi:hypothetical protein
VGVAAHQRATPLLTAMDDRSEMYRYEFRVEETIGVEWSGWFDGLEIRRDGPYTRLSGPVADQAALYGLLNKMRDLGLWLVSLQRLDGPRGHSSPPAPRRKPLRPHSTDT